MPHILQYRSLPRVGVEVPLAGSYDMVEWLGDGPHECYPDRKTGARVGLYQSSVAALHTPYVFPQVSCMVEAVVRTRAAMVQAGKQVIVGIQLPYRSDSWKPHHIGDNDAHCCGSAVDCTFQETRDEGSDFQQSWLVVCLLIWCVQENGGRTGVQAAVLYNSRHAVTGTQGSGAQKAQAAAPVLAVFPVDVPQGMQLNVSRFSTAAIHAARHDYELVSDGRTHVVLDHAHMGVGGDDSWSPSVHESYLVCPGVHKFSIGLQPFCESLSKH